MIELKNGRFLDVHARNYFARDSLILSDGKIVFEGRPEQSIDLGGRTVIPALINTHSHIQMTIPAILGRLKDLKLNKRFAKKQIFFAMQDCPLHGVTTVRDTWTEDLNLNRRLQDKISKGNLIGPRIVQSVLVSPKGGPFSPKRGIMLRKIFSLMGIPYVPHSEPNSGSVTFSPDAAPQEVRGAVDRAIDERGADCIKIYDQLEYMLSYKPGAVQMTAEQLAAITDQARHRGVPSTMHHLTVNSFRRGVQAGVTTLAHMPYDADLADEDIRAFCDAGCILEPTLSLAYHLCWNHAGTPAHELMDRLVAHRNSTFAAYAKEFWLDEMQPAVLSGFDRAKAGKTRVIGLFDVAKILRYYSGIMPTGLNNVRRLLQAGAKMTCSNDSGAIPATEAMLGPELALFDLLFNHEDQRPFDGARALGMATINGAEALGMQDRLGSIEVGKTADLAILDGDPLEDYRVIGGQVAALFMEGKLAVNNCGLKEEPV